MTDHHQEAQFTPIEARVLASLMEKQLTTPANYPLTMNSLMLACNQKSNRDPVMNLAQGEVEHTVNQLADRDLAKIEYGDRANKVFHKMRGGFDLDAKQQAILCVLMMRNNQTLNEIRTRTGRMAEFESVDEIRAMLDDMMQREPALIIMFPKSHGRREDRYAHLLLGPVEDVVPEKTPTTRASGGKINELEQRIEQLEERLQRLESMLDS